MKLGTFNGKLYALVFKAANKSLVWYNVPAFKNAGVKPPKTWAQLLAAAKTHQGVGHAGVLDRRCGRLDAHRPVREHLPAHVRAGEVRGAERAQDQVDGPVGQDGAEDDGADRRRHGATSPAGAVRRAPVRLQRLGHECVRDAAEGARWCSRPTSSAASSPRRRRRSRRRASTPSRSRRSTPVPNASGVEIGGDLFVTFRDTPAIEAFVNFLATAPAAEAWAKQGGFGTGNNNVPASIYPGRDHEGDRGADPERRSRSCSTCPTSSRRRSAATDRPGRVGAVPEVPPEPEGRERHPEEARGGRRGVLQEGQVAHVSAGGITAEPPVVAAPPPSAEPGRLGRYLTSALFLAPALVLLGVWMVYPAIYTIIRSFFGQTRLPRHLGRDRQLQAPLHDVDADDGDQEQRDLGRRRAGARHGVRADLRGAHRARALGGRVQDGRLPADGDLRLRDRRDLADHVPAGPEPRRDQRARQVGRRASSARRRALDGVAVDRRRCSRVAAARSS